MKQLIRKPFLFSLLLSLPLWVVFNNYLIAIISALLLAFLASMCHSLYVLKQHSKITDGNSATSAHNSAPNTTTSDDPEHDA